MKISKIVQAAQVNAGIDPHTYARNSLFRAIEKFTDKLKHIPEEDQLNTAEHIREKQPRLYKKADDILRELEPYFN
jgi:hypothetical protein